MKTIVLVSILWVFWVIWTKSNQREKVKACVRSGKSILYCEDKVARGEYRP